MKEFKKIKLKFHFSWHIFLIFFCLNIFLFLFFFFYLWIAYPYGKVNARHNRFDQVGAMPLYTGKSLIDFKFIDQLATLKAKNAAKQNRPLVFVLDTEIAPYVIKEFVRFQKFMLKEAAQYNNHSDLFNAVHKKNDIFIDNQLIKDLLTSENQPLILDKTYVALIEVYNQKVFAKEDLNLFKSPIQVVEKGKEKKMLQSDLSLLEKEDFFLIPNKLINIELEKIKMTVSATDLNNIGRLLQVFIKPNTRFHNDFTQYARELTVSQLEPIMVNIKKGDILFEKGVPLTNQQFLILKKLDCFSARLSISQFIFLILFLIILSFISLILFRPPFLKRKLKIKEIYILLGITILGLLYSFVVSLILPKQMTSIAWYFSVPLLVMVTSMMISPRCGFCLGLIFCALQPLFNYASWASEMGINYPVVIFIFFGMIPIIFASAVVKFITQLSHYLRAGFIVNAVSFFCSLVFVLIFPKSMMLNLIYLSLAVAVNGFLATLLAPGVVILLEKSFNLCSVHRLVDLANTNNELLTQLRLRASGTWSHSMAVSVLAEPAAQAIGANGLLARVGAFYHDIGKMEQPEYFVENQRYENKHNDIKPNLSASIITSHVAKGVQKAKQNNLPKEVIDIIEQHHGTGVIQFFYIKALNAQFNQGVIPDDYRYNNPLPNSKESAIVMLADTVEAACRTLKNPTPQSIQKFVTQLIMDKLNNHQLDEAPITLADLTVIRNSFVESIVGQYHQRIEYPNQNKTEEENQEKKTAPPVEEKSNTIQRKKKTAGAGKK